MYKIFLAEDDEVICSLVKKHLESWGYKVYAAEDFSDIMGEFVRVDPQLVILDLKLPCYNGFHWCDDIRRVSQVPVIFLSSAADNMNMVMAMSRGADDFIPKPFHLEVLSAKVKKSLFLWRRGESPGTGRRCSESGKRGSEFPGQISFSYQKRAENPESSFFSGGKCGKPGRHYADVVGK